MSGMGSTLQLNNPTVVAAFRSALIHQGIIALLIFFLLAMLWVSVRDWVPGSRTSFGPPAGGLPAEPRGRQLIGIGFGVLWILDGLLQAQPAMPLGLASNVTEPSADGAPGWVRQPDSDTDLNPYRGGGRVHRVIHPAPGGEVHQVRLVRLVRGWPAWRRAVRRPGRVRQRAWCGLAALARPARQGAVSPGRRGHPGRGPRRLRGPDRPGRPAVRLGAILRWFGMEPVRGHQHGHSLRLVRVSWVL
jgi:hypothetical protein